LRLGKILFSRGWRRSQPYPTAQHPSLRLDGSCNVDALLIFCDGV
jgi:hypothetical protein